jgi:hypothetical protein
MMPGGQSQSDHMVGIADEMVDRDRLGIMRREMLAHG